MTMDELQALWEEVDSLHDLAMREHRRLSDNPPPKDNRYALAHKAYSDKRAEYIRAAAFWNNAHPKDRVALG